MYLNEIKEILENLGTTVESLEELGLEIDNKNIGVTCTIRGLELKITLKSGTILKVTIDIDS